MDHGIRDENHKEGCHLFSFDTNDNTFYLIRISIFMVNGLTDEYFSNSAC